MLVIACGCLYCAQFCPEKTLSQLAKLNNYVPYIFFGVLAKWPLKRTATTTNKHFSLSLFRSLSLSLSLAELCHAALKIQSTFRGHLARKLVNKDVPEDEDIQEITKKVAEELDIDLTDPELNKAATKIQASFRGHKTRKEANPE